MTDKGFKCPPPQKKRRRNNKTNKQTIKKTNKKFACSCIKLCFMLPN